MLLLLPIGVEGAALRRLPYVSIAIASLCVLSFLSTWVLPRDPEAAGRAELSEAIAFWQEHPYLVLPASIEGRVAPGLRRQMRDRSDDAQRPSPASAAVAQAEQAQLEELARAADEAGALRRYGLVPARGMLQIGWLTHLFLHWGWMHLLGNLLFFYIAGPLLEQALGRVAFGALYLAGGLCAAAAQWAMDPHTALPMVGASGAIATCIGAFTLRHGAKRIRIGYLFFFFFRLWRGSFAVPAWLWGGLWFATELWGWKASAASGIAVAAHVAGFGVGFALAGAFRLWHIGQTEDAHEQEDVAWSEQAAVAEARELLDRGDPVRARAALRGLLARKPGEPQALLALARLELESGRQEAGMAHVDRFLRPLLGAPHGEERAAAALVELGTLFAPSLLSAGVALRLGGLLEQGPEGTRHLALDCFLGAARAPGPIGAKAHLRAAAFRRERREPREAVEAHLVAAEQAAPELAAEVQALRREVTSSGLPSSSFGSAPAADPSPRRVLDCRLLAIGADAWRVEVRGRPANLALRRVVGVAVGVLDGEQAGRARILVDLILSWGGSGQGAKVLRLDGPALALAAHFPGVPGRQAFGSLLRQLLERSGARPLFDAGVLSTLEFPRFADQNAFEAAHYAEVAARDLTSLARQQ